MEIIKLHDTTSTNDFLLDHAASHPEWEGVVVSSYQSDGKGMGTNRWESEPGMNLLFSILIHPTWLPVRRQFLLSMSQALALYDTLSPISDGFSVKWPNDIYWQDRKISGTRIDVNLCAGGLRDVVIGTGVNINQREFHSDAPNPVSLLQITGREHNLDNLLDAFVAAFEYYYNRLRLGGERFILDNYHRVLYRSSGLYPYSDANGKFMASIKCVDPDGILHLIREDGTESTYMFKEVQALQAP